MPAKNVLKNSVHRESVFEPTKFKSDKCIRIKITNCRSLQIPRRVDRTQVNSFSSLSNGVVVSIGYLNRFRYKMNKSCEEMSIFGAMLL